MKKIQKAFSLTELSIVILIIGVLVASIIGAKSVVSKTKQLASKWRIQSKIDNVPETLFSQKVEMWFDSTNINGNFNIGIRDNQKIEKWQDLSGNNYHAIQNNSNYQPTYQRDYGLKFDGNDQLAISKKYYDTTNLENIYIFTVFESSSKTQQIIASFDRTEYWRLALRDNINAVDQIALDTRNISSGVNDFGKSDQTDGKMHILLGFYDIERSPNKALYVDGIPQITGNAHGNTPLGSGAKRYGFIGVGSEAGSFNGTTGPNLYFKGNMHEFIAIEANLTEIEIIEITNYLARKWKLTDSVDSDNDGVFDNQDPSPTNKNQS